MSAEFIESKSNKPIGIMNGNEAVNVSLHFFRFILADKDPRWKLVHDYLALKETVQFKPIHMENALEAIYLSDFKSYRSRYSGFSCPANILQLERAIQNVKSWPWLQKRFDETNNTNSSDSIQIKLARTDSITSGKNKEGVTACPEALYQLRMFQNNKYISRIGFNIHIEDESNVISITNIQGVPGGHQINEEIKEEYGTMPYNILIRRLKLLQESDENIIIKGLKNPLHNESSALYNSVFKAETVNRVHFKRS